MKITIIFSLALLSFSVISCKKLVKIPEPINTTTASETFSTEANATSALIAIYSDMSCGQFFYRLANGATTIYCGLSADEIQYFGSGTDDFVTNKLKYNNSTIVTEFWKQTYNDIYMANAVIEGVQSSSSLSNKVKNQLIGEAKFLRAFNNFYLVNLFGDIPLVTSTDFVSNSLLARSSSSLVYQQIIQDLKDAQAVLPKDYLISGGERIRANLWSVDALLARVYLYIGDWQNASALANSVIGSGISTLLTNLNNVFLKNSNEAILQLQVVNSNPYATQEGNIFIPSSSTSSPKFNLTNQLLGAFEAGDQRKVTWINTTKFSGTTYYYPYKYKLKKGTSGNISEYYTLLRLSEQYLIRAEANANLGQLASAIADLDTIRSRAGLPNLASNLSQAQVLTAVAQERRVELFSEWGHRWFDLKRTGQAHVILSAIPYKQPWSGDYQFLYPIPLTEINVDPNLTQNKGY